MATQQVHSPKSDPPTSALTVRLSRKLHDELLRTAHVRQKSLNKLCVEALEKAVGFEQAARRGQVQA